MLAFFEKKSKEETEKNTQKIQNNSPFFKFHWIEFKLFELGTSHSFSTFLYFILFCFSDTFGIKLPPDLLANVANVYSTPRSKNSP